MSLNAYLGHDNGEMAFAQAYQSMCAGRPPVSHMNPVLLKVMGEGKTEVILSGKSIGRFSSEEYWFRKKKEIKPKVFEIFSEVLKKGVPVFVEGAGSCTEINLKENDFANLELCREFEVPFFVITDIERGGVFAKIIGTWELLDGKEKELLQGFIINKMRGSSEILSEGIKFVERKTGKKVIGVIPYKSFLLPEEDSLGFRREIKKRRKKEGKKKRIKVRVVKTPYLSNFFDFYPFLFEEEVDFSFAFSPHEIEGADLIILGGSRNVFGDLKFLKEEGFLSAISEERARGRGSIIIGICGGFEFFFRSIKDPFGIEGFAGAKVEGFGFINNDVELRREKTCFWDEVEISTPWFSGRIKGFHIRHGVAGNNMIFFSDGNVFGTFLHNIFFSDEFRGGLLRYLGAERTFSFQQEFEKELRAWAQHVKAHLDIETITSLL